MCVTIIQKFIPRVTMKNIKSLTLLLLLTPVSTIIAMQPPTIASIVQDLKAIEESDSSIDEARLRIGIASQHDTPMYYLHAAIAGRKLAAINALVEAGIPAEKDKQNRTPLDYALETNYTVGITTLMKYPHLRNSSYGPPPSRKTFAQHPTQETFLHYCEEAKKAWPTKAHSAEWLGIATNVINNAPASFVQQLITQNLLPMLQTVINYTNSRDPLYEEWTKATAYNAMLLAFVKSDPSTIPDNFYLSMIEFKKKEFLKTQSEQTATELVTLLACRKETFTLDESMWQIYAKAKEDNCSALVQFIEEHINPEVEWQAAYEEFKTLKTLPQLDPNNRQTFEAWLFKADVILNKAGSDFKINPAIAQDIQSYISFGWSLLYSSQNNCLERKLIAVIKNEKDRIEKDLQAHLAEIREHTPKNHNNKKHD